MRVGGVVAGVGESGVADVISVYMIELGPHRRNFAQVIHRLLGSGRTEPDQGCFFDHMILAGEQTDDSCFAVLLVEWSERAQRTHHHHRRGLADFQ